ncbi:hypothetical protein AJ80_07071 [Polytolypa hystricis UAMH7299]|uniref:Alpha/beta hydrolase fold-3 domain-containing protein n=1 Tax=Polytolypa hystricis (strain UAMH7299) TaxID=1447883 RepID=A0A2B7XS57_POLH7|nr:hypothetical protein AJ80_07071 [Polytolypa hystricis UAMH7299]
MHSLSKPPFDVQLEAFMAQVPIPQNLEPEMIPMMRTALAQANTADLIISGRPIEHEEHTIPVPGGGEITLSVFRPTAVAAAAEGCAKKPGPGIYFIHGGGLVMGNRFLGMSVVADWIEELDATCVSVEYRLAPEYPYPTPLEDCYAGLKWVEANLAMLGIDKSRLMIVGQSAGGGLAAALAILARDRGGPHICAQLLMCPMLDHRNTSVSVQQFSNEGTWSQKNNQTGWTCYLGDHGKAETEQVDILASVGRATVANLLNLPSTFIDVGSAETFRDEDVAYANLLWEAGVQVELHVWPGGIHGFDLLLPTADLSQRAIQTRTAWVKTILERKE